MATTNPETKLKLRPNQIEHFQRVAKILSNFYFYIDGSEMGTGKTYIATALAITYNLPCIVVCPMTARKTWSNVFSKYNIGVYNGINSVLNECQTILKEYRNAMKYLRDHDIIE